MKFNHDKIKDVFDGISSFDNIIIDCKTSDNVLELMKKLLIMYPNITNHLAWREHIRTNEKVRSMIKVEQNSGKFTIWQESNMPDLEIEDLIVNKIIW